jgi:hypothetical protein
LSLSPVAVAEEGLVLHYAFSEGRGNVLNDTSGNGNDGKIADAHWLKGKNGFALRFDGVNSYVQCGNGKSLGLSGPLTLAFWIFRESCNPHQNRHYVMGKADYNVYLTAKGNVGFTTISNAPEKKWTTLTSKEVLPLGQWSFVAIVYDKAVRKERIYIDGALDSTRHRLENPDLWVEVPVTLVLGTERYGGDRKMFFPGALAKGVNKVYQFCLTAGGGQWDAIYNDPKVRWADRDWNGTWKGATGFEFQMAWLAEVAIPSSDFGRAPPQEGDVWLIGLFRQGGSAGLSGWAYSGGKFYAPDRNFGEFVFRGQ